MSLYHARSSPNIESSCVSCVTKSKFLKISIDELEMQYRILLNYDACVNNLVGSIGTTAPKRHLKSESCCTRLAKSSTNQRRQHLDQPTNVATQHCREKSACICRRRIHTPTKLRPAKATAVIELRVGVSDLCTVGPLVAGSTTP
jgi:hypothetical protein